MVSVRITEALGSMEFETPEKDKHLGKIKKIKSMILAFGELVCVKEF